MALLKRFTVTAMGMAVAASLVGCGQSATSSPATAVGASATASTESPAAQNVVVGMDASFAPWESIEGSQPVGIDVDLINAILSRVNMKAEIQNVPFDGLIPALKSKRIGIVISAMYDNIERQQSATFVDYYKQADGILGKSGQLAGVTTLSGLCGRKIAVLRGSTQESAATDLSSSCPTDVADETKVLPYPADSQALLALKSGRVDVLFSDYTALVYAAQQGGDQEFEAVRLTDSAVNLYGIAVDKGDTQLAEQIRKGLELIISDGTYAEILKKYSVEEGAVTEAAINQGEK